MQAGGQVEGLAGQRLILLGLHVPPRQLLARGDEPDAPGFVQRPGVDRQLQRAIGSSGL